MHQAHQISAHLFLVMKNKNMKNRFEFDYWNLKIHPIKKKTDFLDFHSTFEVSGTSGLVGIHQPKV